MKVNSWNANVGSSYQRSRRNTWRSNAAFNLQKDKITLQSSIDLGDRRFLRNWNNDLYYLMLIGKIVELQILKTIIMQ
jgi:hypothetical protein